MILFSLKSYRSACFFIFYNKENNQEDIFEISNNYNDIKSLLIFLKSNNNKYIVGYNMEKFNNYILNYILYNYKDMLKNTASMSAFQINSIANNISNADVSLKYNKFYYSIDLLKYISTSNDRITFNDIKNYFNLDIEEPEFNDESYLTKDSRQSIIDFLRENIKALNLLYEEYKNKIGFRISLSKKIGLNVINKFDESIGNNVILSYFKKQYNVTKEQIISLKEKDPESYPIKVSDFMFNIEYKNESFNNFINTLKKTEIDRNYHIDTTLNISGYKFIINKYIKKECNDKIYENDLININFKHIYVETLAKYNIYPSFLGDEFSRLVSDYYNSLLIAYKTGNQNDIDYYSLLLKNLVDNMSVPSSFTESNITQNRVLINSLLIILKLIDELIYKDIEIICLNRDSITLKVKEENRSDLRAILYEWKNEHCSYFNITEYEKLVYIDSNNYLIFKKDYNKNKGLINFDTEEGIKLHDKYVEEYGIFKTKRKINDVYKELIVSKAIQVYLGKNESAKDFIFNSNNTDDFIISYRTTQLFNLFEEEDKIQNYLRYYFTNKNGKNIYRLNISSNKKEKIIENVELINKMKEIKNINKIIYYKRYLSLKEKIINNQLNLF